MSFLHDERWFLLVLTKEVFQVARGFMDKWSLCSFIDLTSFFYGLKNDGGDNIAQLIRSKA